MAGKVVGITTSHIKGGENLNFAIPINDIKPVVLAISSKARTLPDDPVLQFADLRSGHSIRHYQHMVIGDTTRLFLSRYPDSPTFSWCDVPTAEIIGYRDDVE